MFARQVKVKQDIVNLVEQRLVGFVAGTGPLPKIRWNAVPPFLKFAHHDASLRVVMILNLS